MSRWIWSLLLPLLLLLCLPSMCEVEAQVESELLEQFYTLFAFPNFNLVLFFSLYNT